MAWWRHRDVTSIANWCHAYIIRIASNSSGGSFNWTRGSKFVFLMVSPEFNSNFLVLANPTPYSELELLSLYWRFCTFSLNFVNAFLSYSNFLLNCVKFWFMGFDFLPLFLAAWKSDFSFPSFSYLQQSRVLCMVYAPPCLLHRSQSSQNRPSWEPSHECKCAQLLQVMWEVSTNPPASCPSCSYSTGLATR